MTEDNLPPVDPERLAGDLPAPTEGDEDFLQVGTEPPAEEPVAEQQDDDHLELNPEPQVDEPAGDPASDEATDTPLAAEEDADAAPAFARELEFDETLIELRGGKPEEIEELLKAANDILGPAALDAEVRRTGSWANILYRMRMDPNFEEIRSQTALSKLSEEQLNFLRATEVDASGKIIFTGSVLRNEDGKTVLRTSKMGNKLKPGETRRLTGPDAIMAFELNDKGGGYRVPLYNSGLTIDILTPTGTDMQTMLYNCSLLDRELGSSLGAHYFTYNDLMYKTQVLNFLQPLIIGSSYTEWKRKDKLYSVIKLPDIYAIVATLAAICYPDGYPDFAVTCKRVPTKENPELCGHTEKLTADIFKLIVPRYASLPKEAIDHMTAARLGNVKHSAVEIAKYQANLGFEGEKITFGDVDFVMRIPTFNEHMEAGAQFLADIINEIAGDNSQGREEQLGIRYMRTFLPWIAQVEKRYSDGSVAVTDDIRTIVRQLEHIDLSDETMGVRHKFEDFIGRSQITYVGHPILPCSKCGYKAETPSGMWTFDPFSTFFTLAFLYLRPVDSTTTKTDSPNT